MNRDKNVFAQTQSFLTATSSDGWSTSSPEIPEPQRVRHAFTSFCFVNLCNREGFPAMPFRFDTPECVNILVNY
ncbi:MAG: hypothetical protein II943_12285 [Victivallales bacterium]|nr:hypothetical protein [Victivallales bacterium]